jgi:hypothetical protein
VVIDRRGVFVVGRFSKTSDEIPLLAELRTKQCCFGSSIEFWNLLNSGDH